MCIIRRKTGTKSFKFIYFGIFIGSIFHLKFLCIVNFLVHQTTPSETAVCFMYEFLIGSPYRTPISSAILKLQENGRLHLLKRRWWKEKRGGGQCPVSAKILTFLLHVESCSGSFASIKNKLLTSLYYFFLPQNLVILKSMYMMEMWSELETVRERRAELGLKIKHPFYRRVSFSLSLVIMKQNMVNK